MKTIPNRIKQFAAVAAGLANARRCLWRYGHKGQKTE